jgi:nucleoid-associated protein YejK
VEFDPFKRQAYETLYVKMLHESENQLMQFSQACVKVGVDEIRVRAMATQGEAIVAAMKKLLADPRLGILTSTPVDAIIRETLQELAAQASPNAAIARWKS